MSDAPKKWEGIPGVKYPTEQDQIPPVADNKPIEVTAKVEQQTPPTPEPVAVQPAANLVTQDAVKVTESSGDIELSAGTPHQMISAQINLIGWCRAKINSLLADLSDLKDAADHAKRNKWKAAPLERQVRVTEKRVDYYRKIVAALEAGYFIVPNFEATIFAVRTDHKKPLAMINSNWSLRRQTAEQQPPKPIGEGEYKNAVPILQKRQHRRFDAKGNEVEYENWWAESWDEFEFPLVLAKPELMNATTRAMALKIFDDLGITPRESQDQSYSTVRVKGDPMIIGRILGPKIGYAQKKVSFVIGWYLDTKDI